MKITKPHRRRTWKSPNLAGGGHENHQNSPVADMKITKPRCGRTWKSPNLAGGRHENHQTSPAANIKTTKSCPCAGFNLASIEQFLTESRYEQLQQLKSFRKRGLWESFFKIFLIQTFGLLTSLAFLSHFLPLLGFEPLQLHCKECLAYSSDCNRRNLAPQTSQKRGATIAEDHRQAENVSGPGPGPVPVLEPVISGPDDWSGPGPGNFWSRWFVPVPLKIA